MKATVLFFLLLAVTLSLASPQSGGPSAGSDKPDGPRNQDFVPSRQAPFEGLPTPAPFDEASKLKRDEQHDEPQVAEDPEIDSQTLEPPPPPKDPRHKRDEDDEGRHRSQQKRRPSSDDPAYKDAPKVKREGSADEGRHRFEAQNDAAAKRQFHTDVKRDDQANKNRAGDHFEKRQTFHTDVKRRGGPPTPPHHEQEEDTPDARKRNDADQANKNRAGDHFEKRQTFHTDVKKRNDADQANKNRAGDHFEKRQDAADEPNYANRDRAGDQYDVYEKRQKFSTDVKRDEAAAPTPQYKKPHPNGRRADTPFYRPRSTVTEA